MNSQNIDYSIYHRYINKAEELYFVHNKIDSCIYYYKKAFDEFDFIFIKDVVNIIQISYFNNLPYRFYFKKGFENGLKLKHLKQIKLLSPIYESLIDDKGLQKEYEQSRILYLEKINYQYLLQLYDISIRDQINKYLSQEKYDFKNYKLLQLIKKKIKKNGFPGAKILGVEDNEIFAEIGKPNLDFNIKLKRYQSMSVANHNRLKYFLIDENSLTSSFFFIYLIT